MPMRSAGTGLDSNEAETSLSGLATTLKREAHVLLREGEILPSHLCNRIFLQEGDDEAAGYLLARAASALTDRPWLRLDNRPSLPPGRSSLLRVLDHGATVTDAEWSPDGSALASAGADGAVRLWDPTTGTLEMILRHHDDPVSALAWSTDGSLLASGDSDGAVRVWEALSGAMIADFKGDDDAVADLSWSPRRPLLAIGYEDGPVRLWSPAAGGGEAILTHPGESLEGIAFCPDGALLATAGGESVRLWLAETGAPAGAVEEEEGSVQALAWFPDGTLAATWSSLTSFSLSGWASHVYVYDVEPRGDRSAAALAGNRGDAAPRGGRREAAAFGYLVQTVAFSPDGRTIACGGGGPYNQIDLLDRASFAAATESDAKTRLRGHVGPVRALAFSPAGSTVASAGDTSVRLWDVDLAWEDVGDFTVGHGGDSVGAVALSPDGHVLASGGDEEDDHIYLWDTERGGRTRQIWAKSDGVYALAYSPDGGKLASSGLFKISIWSVDGGEEADAEIWGENASLDWSPDGDLLAAGGIDGSVRIWRPDSEDPRAVLDGHGEPVLALAWSPRGDRLASGGRDNTVRVWDPRDGRCLAVLEGHRKWLRALAWSPDGTFLASGSNDATVRIWKLGHPATADHPQTATVEPATVLDGHEDSVSAVAWSRDGALLASGDVGGAVRLWNPTTGDRLAAAHCLSGVTLISFDAGGGSLGVADDGAAAGNRPLLYRFELCNLEPSDRR